MLVARTVVRRFDTMRPRPPLLFTVLPAVLASVALLGAPIADAATSPTPMPGHAVHRVSATKKHRKKHKHPSRTSAHHHTTPRQRT
jgi:hypothetical protein